MKSLELLQDLLHDLSQPVGALQCSIDVALMKPRTNAEYVQTLEDHKRLSERLRGLIERFRNLAPNDRAPNGMDESSTDRAIDRQASAL